MQTTKLLIPISVKVFICYAQVDRELHKKLRDHLMPLIYSGRINIHDAEIPADADWSGQVSAPLQEADVVLLLVSSSFIASKYCWNREIRAAIEQDKTGTVRVIPIILRPVNLKSTPLEQLKALPKGAKPVTQWNDPDAALKDAVQSIENIVDNLFRKLEGETQKREIERQKEIQRKERIVEITHTIEEKLIPTYKSVEGDMEKIDNLIYQQEKRKQELEAEIQQINAAVKEAKIKKIEINTQISRLGALLGERYRQLTDLGVDPRHFSEKCFTMYQQLQQQIANRFLPRKT